MERNNKLIIAFDGTHFHGWQKQAGVRTVQDEIEKVAGAWWAAPSRSWVPAEPTRACMPAVRWLT